MKTAGAGVTKTQQYTRCDPKSARVYTKTKGVRGHTTECSEGYTKGFREANPGNLPSHSEFVYQSSLSIQATQAFYTVHSLHSLLTRGYVQRRPYKLMQQGQSPLEVKGRTSFSSHTVCQAPQSNIFIYSSSVARWIVTLLKLAH